MGVWLECAIGVFAAVGLVCILKGLYDIIVAGSLRTAGLAELFLFGDGTDPRMEEMIHAAQLARRQHLPGLRVVFVETGDADGNGYNYAKMLATRSEMEYIG